MQIPRSTLDGYSSVLNAQSELAQEEAHAELVKVINGWDGEDIATLRADTIKAIEGILGDATDEAAALSASLYDHIRDMQGVEQRYTAEAKSCRDAYATDGAVRGFVETVRKTGETDRYVNDVLSRVDYEVRRATLECTDYNAKKDPAKPRYGRVPSGAETCGFCLMLASFGFNCNSVEAASHTHEHCNCVIVSNYGKVSVQGYYPEIMGRNRKKCLETIGGERQLHEDWLALPEEERQRLIERHRSKSKAERSYCEKRISQEIETRDHDWFKTGKVPAYGIEKGANPSKKEKDTAEKLAQNGWKSAFRPTRDKEMKRTSDVYFLSGKDANKKTRWEFKGPEGGGKQTLYHQLEEAAGQANKVVIDLSECNPGRLDDEKYVVNTLEHIIRYEYKIQHGTNKGDAWRFDEVLVVFKNGSVRKVARPLAPPV